MISSIWEKESMSTDKRFQIVFNSSQKKRDIPYAPSTFQKITFFVTTWRTLMLTTPPAWMMKLKLSTADRERVNTNNAISMINHAGQFPQSLWWKIQKLEESWKDGHQPNVDINRSATRWVWNQWRKCTAEYLWAPSTGQQRHCWVSVSRTVRSSISMRHRACQGGTACEWRVGSHSSED